VLQLFTICACVALATGPGPSTEPVAGERAASAHVLELDGTAYAAASEVTLAKTAPLELASLHNVYRLSENIVTGAEPHDAESFAAIAGMGVKTILSVDGKTPDAAAAAALGMRYVHIPIQYWGISDDELVRLAKTFRELPGPFYVHCFHGKHRGPAAASVGRLVLDGASREQTLAEMRQWCGTASQYEGLYQSIALGDIPDAATTAAYEWSFPAAHSFEGFRGVMISVSRAFDSIESMQQNGWAVPSHHPDIDPVNESAILASLFERAVSLDELADRSGHFEELIRQSRAQSLTLRDALMSNRRTGGADWARADAAFNDMTASCNACHTVYRNR
jgi:protein tyrosine phosphatase (PTP) superfamily phosphohydrolase (DUF442 family)